MKDLSELRAELDTIDTDLVHLFERRMQIVQDVVAYKLDHGMPVLDTSREQQVLTSRVATLEDSHWDSAVRRLFVEIMAISRDEQQRILEEADHHA